MGDEEWRHCDDCPNVYRWSCHCFGTCVRGKEATVNLLDELLPQDAPLSDRFEQIREWLYAMGYQTLHSGGVGDDTDWDVEFVPALPGPPDSIQRWVYHSDTRQGLAKSLVRHVWRWEGR